MFLIIAGIIAGLISVLLVLQGNPANMGFCIACFLRDIAGGLGLHRAAVVQYLRPEIIGLVLGSFAGAFYFREYRSTGGSSTVLRFFLGADDDGSPDLPWLPVAYAPAHGRRGLERSGCFSRLHFRHLGRDLFLKKGYSLGAAVQQPAPNGAAGPFFLLFACSRHSCSCLYLFQH